MTSSTGSAPPTPLSQRNEVLKRPVCRESGWFSWLRESMHSPNARRGDWSVSSSAIPSTHTFEPATANEWAAPAPSEKEAASATSPLTSRFGVSWRGHFEIGQW